MSGFLGRSLARLLKDGEELVAPARAIGELAYGRHAEGEEATNVVSGRRTFRYQIEFDSLADLTLFADSVRELVDAVTGERR
jgi:hypothetical protein